MWQLTKNKNWRDLEERFDWVRDMNITPQDPKHHAEGNVAVHTQMVIEELIKSNGYQSLSTQNQEILWTSALMHDIEKRSTTVYESDGSITSRGHAKKGELSARSWLYQYSVTPFEIREQIAKLVKYHGLPLWFLEKPSPQKAMIQTNLEVNMQWLSLLAESDAKGRICHDQEDLLYRNGLFKAYCGELGCWEKPFVFKSNLAQFQYFKKDFQSLDYEPFDKVSNEVIMLSGLPGTGKDTYIKNALPEHAVVSLDNIRRTLKVAPTDSKGNGMVIQQAKEMAKVYLRKHQPFVLNATNITRSLREIWIDLFVSYAAKVKLIYLEVPYAQLVVQNKNRKYPVPDNVLHRMVSKLEVPAIWEAHEVLYLVQ